MVVEKFSVLMSIYAKENPEYFDEALKSVFGQTKKPSEVVIVEDGPLTEELKAVIDKYKSIYLGRIKTIKNKQNEGLGLALRKGLLQCSNNIVFRMDTDDICKRDRFEKQLKLLKESEYDIIGSNIDEYDETMAKKTGTRIVPETGAQIKEWIKTRNPMNHMTVAYKKDAVLEAGNYEEMPYFEDYYLWAKMIKNGCHFCNIQESLVDVRGGKEMIKRRGGKKYLKPMRLFERKLLELGIISKKEYIVNIFKRQIVSLMPNNIRQIIYRKALRK